MEETLKQILSELKYIRIDINELKQGQQNLEVGQKRLEAVLTELRMVYKTCKRTLLIV